jgi:carboxyl-terminal processing protease
MATILRQLKRPVLTDRAFRNNPPDMRPYRPVIQIITAIVGVTFLFAQPLSNVQRETARQMMRDVADGIRKHYYDPKFHGVDLEVGFKAADERIRSAASLSDVFRVIAASIDTLDDSHTFFSPPTRATRREFGYALQMIGDRCLITAVRPGSDASEKLSPGDEVLAWEGYAPGRDNIWKLNYVFMTLNGQVTQHLAIRTRSGAERQVEVKAKLIEGKRILDLTGNGDGDVWQVLREMENDDRAMSQRVATLGDSLMIWKMPEFDLNDDEVDRMMKQARKYPALVIDLRGNPGGLVKTLERVTGGVMDHDVTIATRIGRRSDLKPQVAKTRSKESFSGKLMVLIDSRSASAAELFARVVQLQKRGTVLGDRSSGHVMESRYYSFRQGTNTVISYGASITDADLIMGDGKSLEHNGVVPDELILPADTDLSSLKDPVLARAAKLGGVDLEPAQAGKMFPLEWRKD